jgi:diguanylate cyclase (GGDEF)-like protein
MLSVVRNCTIVSIVLLGVLTILLGYTFQQLSLNSIIRVGERENQSLAKFITGSSWDEFSMALEELQKLSNRKLRQHQTVRDIGQLVRKIGNELNMLKLSIYAPNGRIVFSTEQNQLAEDHSADAFFNRAKKGETSSRLRHRRVVNSLDGMKLERDIVTSYLPLIRPGNASVEGVYEITADITDLAREGDKTRFLIYVLLALGYIVIVALVLAGVRSKNLRIARQAAIIDKQEAKIEHKSYHDPLTGLPNRELFYARLQYDMQSVEENERLLAVLVINLCRLQKINDTLGYRFGDSLLLETAYRLKQCVRKGDTVGRLSGDKFVIILQDITVVDQVEEVAEHIMEAASEPYFVEDNELFIFPSVGISLYPFSHEDADGLIKKANAAMYRAQSAGRNTYRYYNPVISKQATSRFTIENSLRHALERNEFELHYQPIILLKTGEIYGMEALLRWRSPEFGMVSPLEFIPLLEDTGLIKQVGLWVLGEACRQAVVWHEQGHRDLKIHVNVSAIQFLQKEIVRQVDNAIDSSGIMPHLLDLEITESLLIDGVSQTIETLETLNEMGVSLSIDDFGTGYSSLAYLKRLPIDTLKIDRSFIRDVAHNFDDAAIVDAICALSRSLRFKVIVEGIENHEQLSYMNNLGVSGAQGYLFSRPMPVSDVEEFLRRGGVQAELRGAAI